MPHRRSGAHAPERTLNQGQGSRGLARARARARGAQDFEGLLQRMNVAEAALHAAADDLAEYRVAIEMKLGKAGGR